MTIVRKNYGSPGFSDWLEDFFAGEVFNPLIKSRVSSVPMVNVFESENSFRIEVAVPGINKEDIKINLENEILKISAELEGNIAKEGEKCTKREYNYKSFSRSFSLPDAADGNQISAESMNGILMITIMKKEEEIIKAPREIEIK
jgi:HSP20 family protein